MAFRVSGKNIDIGEALRTRVNARVAEALVKYFDGGYSGHVTVGKDGNAVGADAARIGGRLPLAVRAGAIQRAGDDAGGGSLSHAPDAGQHKGMRDPAGGEGIAQDAHHRLLTDQLELVRTQAHELSASRARIVQAQDEERRRIQRDLHDGVQQHLVTLAAKLRRATTSGAEDQKELVRVLASEAEDTVFALQDFSNGIYPSVLSDEGLPAALWTHAQRLPVTVDLDIAPEIVGQRFGRECETALYFVALEAIVNAQKHALSERISVTLRLQGKDLQLEVADQGRGMPGNGEMRGQGLSNMRDRVAALGGSLQVESHPGAGTRVVASVAYEPKVTAPEATPANRSAQPTLAD